MRRKTARAHKVWLGILACLALVPARPAYAGDLCTNTRLGASGAWHVPTADICERRLLSFSLAGGFADSSGLVLPTDDYKQWSYDVHVAWTIVPAWQVGLGLRGISSRLTLPAQVLSRGTGATELFGKYTFPVGHKIAGAAMLHIKTPSAAPVGEASGAYQLNTFSAVPSASTVTPQVSFTWQHPLLTGTLNLGYAFDNSSNLLARPPSAEQAAGMNIAAGNRINLQAAACHDFPTRLAWLTLVPFLEMGAAFPGQANVKNTAASLTAGGKALFGSNRSLEATLGVDVGLAGLAPAPTDIPTMPQWALFLQFVVNVERLSHNPPACKVCPPPPPANVPARVLFAADPNRLSRPWPGVVVDANTGAAVSAARVHVAGLEAVLTADPHTGVFTTWPLDTNQATYTWTAYAPGYLATSVTMNPRQWGKPIRLAMAPNQGVEPVNLRGIVRNGADGQAVPAAKIFLPHNGQVITCDTEGGFAVSVRPGHLEVIVSEPSYVTQKKTLEADEGETVILNVDLRSKRARRAKPKPTPTAETPTSAPSTETPTPTPPIETPTLPAPTPTTEAPTPTP